MNAAVEALLADHCITEGIASINMGYSRSLLERRPDLVSELVKIRSLFGAPVSQMEKPYGWDIEVWGAEEGDLPYLAMELTYSGEGEPNPLWAQYTDWALDAKLRAARR